MLLSIYSKYFVFLLLIAALSCDMKYSSVPIIEEIKLNRNFYLQQLSVVERKLKSTKKPELYALHAHILQELGEPKAASQSIQNALNMGSTNAENYFLAAKIYLDMREYDRALKQAIFAQQQGMYSFELFRLISQINLNKGNALEALNFANKAIFVNPYNYEGFIYKGYALIHYQDTAGAINAFQRSIEIKETANAYLELVDMILHTGDASQARYYLEKLYPLRGKDKEVTCLIARMYALENKTDSAAVEIKTLLNGTASDTLYYLQLINIFTESSELDSLRHYKLKYFELNPFRTDILLAVATLDVSRYRYTSALKIYEQLIAMDSTNQFFITEYQKLHRKIAYLRAKRRQEGTRQTVPLNIQPKKTIPIY